MSEFAHNLAVVIGINQYDGGIAPLQTAANDATALAQILKEKHNYQVRLWVNEQATLTNLNRLFEELLPKTVTEGDRLLFYFAGHGIALNGEDGPEGYLIPQDARLGKVESYLPMSELNAALAKLPCRHFLAVLDCCFAGAFRWSSNRDVSTVPEVIHKERYDRFIQDPAWQVITSAAHDQKALDILTLRDRKGSTNSHSPFADALMDALSGGADSSPPAKDDKPAGDGVITATELYLYLRDEVERNTENSTKRQTPGLWCLKNHDKGEYIFLTPGHKLNLPPAPPLDVSKNPYRGLASFEEEHSNLFFGRSTLTKRLQEFVVQHPLTIALGASGSGKSSLVKAGLIPYLKQLNKGQDTQEKWKIIGPIRPGESPITALHNALKDSISPLANVLTQAVELDEKTLVSGIANWKQQHPDAKLLLVIDQFEELVTLCRDEVQREQFLKLLAHVLNSCSGQFHLLLTLRSDFEPQFRDTPLETYWKEARFIVAAMTREELREAIEEPALLRVMSFEPHNLIDQLIDEVAQMPGALPLLSFALSELYLKYLQRQEKARHRGETIDRAITQRDYDELGGVTRSLTQRADQEYEALIKQNPAYTQTIRNVMLRMLAVGGELARRRVLLFELEYLEPENTRVKDVIHRFSEARLLTSGTDSEDQPYVEPAHDVLVRGWQRLLDWKQQELTSLLLQRELTSRSRKWLNTQKDKGSAGLLWDSDPRLPLIKQSLKSNPFWLSSLESEFIKRSIRRKRNRFYRTISVTGGVIISLLILVLIIFIQLQISILREQSTAAKNLLHDKPIYGLASIIGTVGESLSMLNEVITPVQSTLFSAVETPTERTILETFNSNSFKAISFSFDSQFVQAVDSLGRVLVWNQQGQLAREHCNTTIGSPDRAIFSPNKEIILTSSTIYAQSKNKYYNQLWNLQCQKTSPPFAEGENSFIEIAFSANNQLIAVVNSNGSLSVYNLEGIELNKAFQVAQGGPISMAFSPDDQLIAISDNQAVRLFDLEGKQLGKTFLGHKTSIKSVGWSADGQHIVSISNDGVRLSSRQGEQIGELIRIEGDVFILSQQNGTSFIISKQDSETVPGLNVLGNRKSFLQIWDLEGNAVSKLFQGGDPTLTSFNSTGKLLISGTYLWDFQEQLSRVTLRRHEKPIRFVKYSSDGQAIISVDEGGVEHFWSRQGDVLNSLPKTSTEEDRNLTSAISYSPNASYIASAGSDKSVKLWNRNGELIGSPFQGHEDVVTSVAFNPQGDVIVSGSLDQTVRLWDLKGNELVEPFRGHEDGVTAVAFSPDGQLVVSGSADQTIRIWDLTGYQLGETLYAHEGSVTAVAFSPDGQLIVSGGNDQTVRLWQAGNWKNWLQIGCKRLRYHPILREPMTLEAKKAFDVCEKY